MRWMRYLLLFCVLTASIAAFAIEIANPFGQGMDFDNYDCTLTLLPAAKVTGTVRVTVEGTSPDTGIILTLSRQFITLDPQHTALKPIKVPAGVVPGTRYQLTVSRRGTEITVFHGEALLYQGKMPRAKGANAYLTVGSGWTAEDARVQRLEPVVFTDNFMRTPDETKNWAVQSGDWAVRSPWDDDPHNYSATIRAIDHASNPFTWVGKAANGGMALCTAGQPFWEDYSMSAAVFPGANGAVGLVVNMPDPKNGIVIRWGAANDRGPLGNRIAICTLTQGKLTVLAEDRGGYVPGHWYRLSADCTFGTLRVAVDGKERVSVKNPTPRRGGIGLYAEGKSQSAFDDISVYSHALPADQISELHAAQISATFANDRKNQMTIWASNDQDWTWARRLPNVRIYNNDVFGDQLLSLQVQMSGAKAGQLRLTLNGDTQDANNGYRMVAEVSPASGKPTYILYQGSKELIKANGSALKPGEDYAFRFCRAGSRLWLELDGTTVLEATITDTEMGLRPSYHASGAFIYPHDVLVVSRNILDYTFSDAPVDWSVGEGTWMPTIRWACSPTWSFLGGWGRGDVVLWQKNRFNGDQNFGAFFGTKMEYPREKDVYDNRYRDYGIAICSDGHNPRSGYAAMLGAADTQGTPNRRTILIRDGVEVGSAMVPVPSAGRESPGHQMWYELELRKRGETVEVYALGRLVITYKDPQPLTGGVPAIWTANNGIVVARARLSFANPPQPFTRQLVTIDDPWYPDWLDIGTPLALNFPNTWSVTGKPVTLRITPRDVPEADRAAFSVQGTNVTLAPTALGEHWYQITASDGDNTSSSVHITAPVFSPTLGRDDAHALVLYRFDEGSGDVVHDQSTVAPAVNLRVLNAGSWLPGRGFETKGTGMLTTPRGVAKLKAIQQTKACTVELWVSTTSIYPVGIKQDSTQERWIGTIFTCEDKSTQRNFTVAHQGEINTFAARSLKASEYDRPLQTPGFRTGLQHLVFAWNGTTTSAYINGAKVGEKAVAWKPEEWSPTAPFYLGMRSDRTRPYLGTYYLVAIHDKCLTQDDVTRHYQAGPAAR